MIRKFNRLTEDIEDLEVVGCFEDALEALDYVKKNPIEAAFLDVEMPEKSGIEIAREMRKIRNNLIIVFVTAFGEYIRDSNEMGGDYYVVKPYTKEALKIMMQKLRLLAKRQDKDIYVQMFGRFLVK